MKRGRILIIIGLLLACGTAAIVFFLLQNMAKEPTVEVKKEDVVVAIQPIEDGQSVEGRLELQDKAVEAIPEGALRTLEPTVGMLATGLIPQGAIVTPAMLQTKEEQMQKSKLGQLVEPGYVAVAFPISELSSVSYGAMPGDYVDVLVTFTFIDVDTDSQAKQPICPKPCPTSGDEAVTAAPVQIPRSAAQLTLQKLKVLGVGRWAYKPPAQPAEGQTAEEAQAQQEAQTPPQFITLMVTSQDALVLKLARESNAAIELAVRAKDDMQDFATQQVTLDYLLARFGISVPARHDYTLKTLETAPSPSQ